MRTAVVLAALLVTASAHADTAERRTNLASFGAGAIVVKDAVAYDEGWSGFWLLDEEPSTGYATPEHDLTPKEIVIELADKDELNEVSFDIAGAESEERSVKTVSVDISDKATGPWTPFVTATLTAGKDDQHTKAPKAMTGRYLRVTLKDNHGSPQYIELMGFGAYGKVVTKMPVPDYTGAYKSNMGEFRVKATGITAVGCYENKEGLIKNGGFDGRVLRFTWVEKTDKITSGPAVLVFPADGKTFLGLWWNEGESARGGRWDGTFSSKTVGTCPHYKFPKGNDVATALKTDGRVRMYGITFDTDSDHIKDESKPTLAQLVAAAKAEPTWKLAIEGHTDSSGDASHNQTLSDKRAAAVKAYLVKAGVAGDRLTTKGYGATKPVTTNDTTLGRSQNRRVEVVKS
ncbi:hypothetical protein BH11MYX2_BH11MYX2_21090 [soil metagenome]